jgi:hypothetical protein
MNKIILCLGLGSSVMLAAGAAQAATCHEASTSIEQKVRSGQPVNPDLSQLTMPSLGGALATSDTAAAIADAGREPAMTAINTPRQRTAHALEDLAQARIYGGLGQEDACLIALHEALSLLD